MPKFSIIVPVYNNEKYIERCIKSITSQTFTDFELILVDDGSKDNSLVLCKRYEETDRRIKTIHQENKGVSSARNTGLAASTGKFILFVDSDDFVAENMLSSLSEIVASDSLVHFGFSLVKSGSVISEHTNGGIFDLISGNGGEIWRCCFPASIKEKCHFDTNLIAGEDYLFHISSYCLLKKITVITKPFYFYTTDNSESTMHTKFLQNCDSQITATVCAENLLATHNLLNKETIKALETRKAWCKEQIFKYGSKTLPAKKTLLSRIMHKALFVVLKRLYRWDY